MSITDLRHEEIKSRPPYGVVANGPRPLSQWELRPHIARAFTVNGDWVPVLHNADGPCPTKYVEAEDPTTIVEVSRDEVLILMGTQRERQRLGLQLEITFCANCLVR